MTSDGGGGSQRRNHLRLTRPALARAFVPPSGPVPRSSPARARDEHAARLLGELGTARDIGRKRAAERLPGFETAPGGVLLDVGAGEGVFPTSIAKLGNRSDDVRVGVVRQDASGRLRAALVTGDEGIERLERAVSVYRTEDTAKTGQPKLWRQVESVESVAAGDLDTLWGDVRPLPETDERLWWQCWCWPDRIEALERAAAALECRVSSDQRQTFPELELIPVHATRDEIRRIVFSSGAVGELRLASDTPRFWMAMGGGAQREWEEDLADRIDWPSEDAPAACLLDTGVNRGHRLIEPALSERDAQAVLSDWTPADDQREPHGTLVAGLALYGDLVPVLAGSERVTLEHRLESVKVFSTAEPDAHEVGSYGPITQQAIYRAEVNAPRRERAICLAVSQEASGDLPSAWSAAIDQAAAGEEIDGGASGPRAGRLILVAGGNVPDGKVSVDADADMARFGIEDPAQAWNALTIGGYTDKTEISDDEEDLEGYTPLADAGERSPYSRTSQRWNHGATAIKPELVFEAGNQAVAPEGNYIAPRIDSLSLLSTGADVVGRPFDTMWATSAAVPQAARMAAMVWARYPGLRPETVRALLVHGARWTPAMRERLDGEGKTGRRKWLRTFGYGVPRLDRVLESVGNDLALFTEETITPYRRGDGGRVGYGDLHVHELPWPVETLQRMGAADVSLKVTLSYFVEPSPGRLGAVSVAAYRSAGLRFALQRPTESVEAFRERVNSADRDDDWRSPGGSDDGWFLGPKAVSGGSLHCDIWRGNAAELAARRHLAIYPVSGWWKELARLGRHKDSMAYSLVVSLETEDEEVDLYTEIEAMLEVESVVST